MHEALMYNPETGGTLRVTAEEYIRDYLDKPWIEQVELRSPYDGNPIYLRQPRKRREGHLKPPLQPHFALMPGYGDQAHLFDRSLKPAFDEAVGQHGQSVLLNLNENLSYRDLDFSEVAQHTARGGMTYQHWLEANRGRYQTVSVGKISQAIKAIQRVHSLLGNDAPWQRRIFANYRGGVIPYPAFFISRHRYRGLRKEFLAGSALPDVFNRLQGEGGVRLPSGKSRAVGLPRIVQFLPTKAMKEAENPIAIRGTSLGPYDQRGSYLFSQLIFANDDDKRRTPEYQWLREQVLTNPGGVYVMASPCVTVHPPAELRHKKGKQIRWIINDIEEQTYPAEVPSNQMAA